MVLVRAPLPVHHPVLGRAADAARQLGVDVNVRGALLVGVLLQVQRDGGEADGGAGEPADALLWRWVSPVVVRMVQATMEVWVQFM